MLRRITIDPSRKCRSCQRQRYATQQKAIAPLIQRVKLIILAGSVELIEVNIVKALRYKKGSLPVSENTRLIKKYPNRRLYDTATSSYITLADVKKLVLEQILFRVVDAKSNEDLTRSILLQIILEEEGAGAPMFTSDMLSQIIRFYGNAMQGMMGTYLEKNIQTFMEIQRRLQEQSLGKMGDNPMLNTDAWSQFVKMQGPAIQGLMTSYLEQSAQTFLEMQQQLQKQARNIFGAFQFPNFANGYPGFPPAGDKPATEDPETERKS